MDREIAPPRASPSGAWPSAPRPWTWPETILGAAAHHLHHARQMQLIGRKKGT